MRANEFIVELFQPGKEWEWDFRGSEEAVAKFKVGDIPYIFIAYAGISPTTGEPSKIWEVEFKQAVPKATRTTKFGLTKTGNAATVMSTVSDIMRSFLEQYKGKVSTLIFSAEEDSRQALYARMVNRLLPDWSVSKEGQSFVLTAPQEVDEASYEGNLGMMEMMQFFKVATQDEKDYMKSLLAQGMQEEAWELLQQVTGEELVDEGVWDSVKKGAAAGAIALGALGAGNADAKAAHPVMKPSTYQKVDNVKPAQQAKNQAPEEYNALSKNLTNEIILQKAAKRAGMKGTELAQFLAQMKHESWDFERMKEKPQPGVKDYYAKRYDMKYSPKTAKILGNKQVGDGARYHGRGFVQLTGRDNYRMASDALGIDLLRNPELASKPEVAAKIAVWYWQTRVKPGIQNFADTRAVTQRINPALRGVEDRHENFKDYMRII